MSATEETAGPRRPDLSRYGRLPRSGRAQAWSDRLDQITRDYPSVTADAHHWLTSEAAFIDLVRDVIKVGQPRAKTFGPRIVTADEARADWHRLVTAITGSPPAPPPDLPPRTNSHTPHRLDDLIAAWSRH